MDFTEQALRDRLAGRRMGGAVLFFPEVNSTNEVAFALAVDGAEEGTAVVADAQKGGRGRLRRRWESPPGCNLYTSIILRPFLPPAAAPQMTLVTGVAVADCLSRYCSGIVSLKWPNDVLLRGRKVCGILAEMRVTGAKIQWIIVGIGVNINVTGRELAEAGLAAATSLREETGRTLSRLDVMEGICTSLERRYEQFLREGFESLRREWLRYAGDLGGRIQVLSGSEIMRGEMAGLSERGGLLIRNECGVVHEILAGETAAGEG